MKIPTANVVVAFNQETMERLFSSGATYKSLVAELSEGQENALLFDNVANPNFISFEHSLGLGGGMKMVLTFIDPKDEFETRFFTTNPARLIEGFTTPGAENTVSFITDKPDDVKQSQEKYSQEFVAQYKTELKKAIGERDIYVAYGVGNNLDLWSGPHRTILTNADIAVKGAKKITLTMTPTSNAFDIGQRRGAYNEKVNLNLQGLKLRYAGESQEIKFNEAVAYDPVPYLNLGNESVIETYREENVKLLQSLGYEQLTKPKGVAERFDFHCMVVDAIRSYVQKATNNKNVIVLLPNLNLTCRQAINDKARKFSVIEPSGIIAGGDVLASGVEQISQTLASFTPNEAGAAVQAFGTLAGGFAQSRAKDLATKAQSDEGRTEMFVESTLKAFGLRLHSAYRDEVEKLKKQAKPNAAIGKHTAYEKYPKYSDAIEDFYSARYFTAVIDKTDRQVPDHMAVLKEVFDNIKKLSHESYKMSSLAVMTETDMAVTKKWRSTTASEPFAYHYLFGGYDTFEGESAIIVGDLALIKTYLYGGVDLTAKEASIKSLKDKANKSSIKQFKEEDTTTSGPTELTAADYNLAASLQHPLHPLDKAILTNTVYNKAMREILYPVLRGSGGFGDISYIPDDFAYQDEQFSNEEKKYIEESGIPVFRYNTQNPNVLDLKFKFGAIYFALLKNGYQKEISRLGSAVAEGVLPTGIGTFPIRTRGAAIAYLVSKGFSQGNDQAQADILNSLAERISPDLAEDLEVNSAEAGADSFAAVIEELEENNLRGLVLVDQELPGNPNSMLADFSEDLYRKALQMNITTLPTFHISRLSSVSSPCIVFAQDQPIKQSQRGKRKLLNKFFSGLYKIMGFKHTITTSAATSEFKLVKNAPKFKPESEDAE